MPTALIASIAGVLGIALNCLLAWPQVARAFRSVEGIALGTIIAGFTGRVLWSVHALQGSGVDVPLLVGQVPIAIGFAVIAFLVGRARPELRGRLLLTLLSILAVVVGTSLLSPAAVAAAAVVVTAVINLPQMVRVIRRPDSAAGVSAAMYWLTAAASASWIVYGALSGDWTIPLPHLLLLPTGVITALAVQRSRPESAAQ
ncbi:hypothetical protein [Helcobacillus massiliensis]|uniref:Uncharacterized protein with PQ loop repeat n=1 Tax=Helcobacillus massiliensis TaxID=521392 RepID=A0A839QZR5_9MICO|nr:hypothetical protein [Helcobacillus massiliensis]MBB3023451.1 uncharacterized protein with PQ loop repeat [Helcobacillus massiliensis]